jgi:hypothetical protein
MPRYSLRWRQLSGEGSEASFVLRRVYGKDRQAILSQALRNSAVAWNSEYQVETGDEIEFTTLHRIQDWASGSRRLPEDDPASIWRSDLRRDLVADHLICTIRSSLRSAVGAGVIEQHDAEALVRLVQTMLRRPRL